MIPECGRQRQVDPYEFKSSLVYTENPCPKKIKQTKTNEEITGKSKAW